jgi:phytoene dehydrogenase-like protein
MGYALQPAGPLKMIFADGVELMLPTDRGGQFAILADAYGRPVAERWRQLLDRLDEVWQALRGLGLETEFRGRRELTRKVRQNLLGRRRTLADLATSIDHQHLGAVIRSIGYRAGSVPERTPAFAAVELSIMRTFGRWQVQPIDTGPGLDAGRSSILIEALATRLALRKVEVHLGCEIESIKIRNGEVASVGTSEGDWPAAAVVATCDPWQLFSALLPVATARQAWRRLPSLTAAAAPTISHYEALESRALVDETVTLSDNGVPTVRYLHQSSGKWIQTVHDFNQTIPRPSYGMAWSGFNSWLGRPAVTTEIPGLYTAGPWSPAGPGASQVVLSAALAAHGCDDYLRPRIAPADRTTSGDTVSRIARRHAERSERRRSFLSERRRSRRYEARSAPAMFAPPICRGSRRNASKESELSDTIVSSDPTKTAAPQRTSQRAQRAIGIASAASHRHSERSEP